MAIETQLLTIDNPLRLILFGLECVLDVEFDPGIVEQIFSLPRVSNAELRYTLWSGPRLKVTGHIEDYEPDDLWLTVNSDKSFTPRLSAIVERAKYQAYRLERWQDSEDNYFMVKSENGGQTDLLSRITINPNQCGGRPCIRRMRIRVTDVLDLFAAGLSAREIQEELPDLEPEDIQACLQYAATCIEPIGLAA